MHNAAFLGSKFTLLMHLGCVFHLLFLLGVIFFAVWAIKNLSKDKFKKLWIWFLVIGLVGSIIFSGGARFKKRFSCDKTDKISIMQEVRLEQGFDGSDEQMEAMMESVKEKMGSMKGKAHGEWFKR